MNNFTKEYIELCKSEKVQGLKKKYYQGDWIIPKDKKMMVNIFDGIERLDYLWLPTGDQLDDEIVKIIEEEARQSDYELKLSYNVEYEDAEYFTEILYPDGVIRVPSQCNHNPLIAKIQLLIKLLEEK